MFVPRWDAWRSASPRSACPTSAGQKEEVEEEDPARGRLDVTRASELLAISPDATVGEVNNAFRKRSLSCHPDRNPDDSAAARKFRLLLAARNLMKEYARASADEPKPVATKLFRPQGFQESGEPMAKPEPAAEGPPSPAASAAGPWQPKTSRSPRRLASQSMTTSTRSTEAEQQNSDESDPEVIHVADSMEELSRFLEDGSWSGSEQAEQESLTKEACGETSAQMQLEYPGAPQGRRRGCLRKLLRCAAALAGRGDQVKL